MIAGALNIECIVIIVRAASIVIICARHGLRVYALIFLYGPYRGLSGGLLLRGFAFIHI